MAKRRKFSGPPPKKKDRGFGMNELRLGMHLLYKLLGILFGWVIEQVLGPKKEEPKVQKEDDAETKWRVWRVQRDEEIEARKKVISSN